MKQNQTSRGKKREITCKCGCGRKKLVRVADINRGWGKYYSKSCKAKEQEKRTGQYADYLIKQSSKSGYCNYESTFHPFDSYSLGQE